MDDTAAGGRMKRRLSIIIPALDEAGMIQRTLQSLAPARARGAEVIVVDGGSRDETASIARTGANIVLRAPRGRASQLNAGAQAASGDMLLFLHADSQPPPDADTAVLNAVGTRRKAWGRFDVRIDSDRPALRLVAMMMNLRSRVTGIATGDQGIFVTRALFEQAGRFPCQRLMEDIEFSRLAKRICAPCNLRLRIVTSGRRWERDGIWRTIMLMWRLRLAYFLGADPDRLAAAYERGR
jgi:rSAM/selenodomain-associated transferase 2